MMSTYPFSVFQHAFQARASQLGCAAINHLLSLETQVQSHLKPHARRTVLLCWDAMLIAPAGQQAFVISENCLLETTPLDGKNADATIHVMAGFLQASADTRLRFVRIEGDVWLAQDLAKVAKQLRWDAEHDLARVIGDTPAYWVAKHAKNAAQLLNQAATRALDSLKSRVSSGSAQSLEWAVGVEAFEAHKLALDELSCRVTALEQRLLGAAR